MQWLKKGRIFAPDGSLWWAKQYAFPATPLLRRNAQGREVLRIYLTCCDDSMVGRLGWVDVDPDDPSHVLDFAKEPLVGPGQPGTFDENGMLPTCILRAGEEVRCYYVGYQLGQQLRYYQFAGLLISKDDGETFQRWRRTSILERSDTELVNRTSTFVMPLPSHLATNGNAWRMWYVGGSEWVWVDFPDGKKYMPRYNLRVVDSPDGKHWPDSGRIALDFDSDDVYAFGRPWVIDNPTGGWRMFYSYRTRSKGYRLGMADSPDLETWTRKDDQIGIDVSADGWDSEGIEYGATFQRGNRMYLFYNGNHCGKTGFGWAELESW
jgi:hypothetical protein